MIKQIDTIIIIIHHIITNMYSQIGKRPSISSNVKSICSRSKRLCNHKNKPSYRHKTTLFNHIKIICNIHQHKWLILHKGIRCMGITISYNRYKCQCIQTRSHKRNRLSQSSQVQIVHRSQRIMVRTMRIIVKDLTI